ncbi:diphthamide biosynthesis methyltransferase [Ordospora colligata]|uniref:diphthine methyl ester synthase n=1 Tax=Ordospora colligata OC4 TaxID=1354746 RepID=A0A0B2UI56_9MICR|nr:diphthamide biosynthesis methyltransferase [Ordospora colligata OC4]KHN68909.1 diphthamide biosynthesis methyltransferase [Ordospora colligata OC4]TBU13943.1 diphthamide biosynthesis methyltransferase [Ordospora colligata]TBU14132.1 diphthamide biosynthesis methyltransferase [Ordospora colligata]TBU17801.1 diphthamide biosynthesis methyltransferase [Ordospora colligata]
MLYLIGIGLHSYKDISLRGLDAVRNSTHVYLEGYTSILNEPIHDLESMVGKEIKIANRETVEQTDQIIMQATQCNVSLLVVGTPLFATTHTDILIRAKEQGVHAEIIHNASIINVMGCCGLYSYSFGRVVTIPYFTDTWKPTSFYTNIVQNIENKLHTLCLLDIKTDEERFMSVNEAVTHILEAADICRSSVLTRESKIFAICRFGSPTEQITYCTMGDACQKDFGKPLHSLIIPGGLDRIEQEFVDLLNPDTSNDTNALNQ